MIEVKVLYVGTGARNSYPHVIAYQRRWGITFPTAYTSTLDSPPMTTPDMDITGFPIELILLLASYLTPSDFIRSRRVCRTWYALLTEPGLNQHALIQHYPLAREMRGDCRSEFKDWSQAFVRAATRYYHLKSGSPICIKKLGKLALGWPLRPDNFYPVATWERHFPSRVIPFKRPFTTPDPHWTYDEGLLVLLTQTCIMIYDLGTGVSTNLNGFDTKMKTVRRIRLRKKVFVVEWCDSFVYRHLNPEGQVQIHFATAYDLSQDGQTVQWKAEFRQVMNLTLSPFEPY